MGMLIHRHFQENEVPVTAKNKAVTEPSNTEKDSANGKATNSTKGARKKA